MVEAANLRCGSPTAHLGDRAAAPGPDRSAFPWCGTRRARVRRRSPRSPVSIRRPQREADDCSPRQLQARRPPDSTRFHSIRHRPDYCPRHRCIRRVPSRDAGRHPVGTRLVLRSSICTVGMDPGGSRTGTTGQPEGRPPPRSRQIPHPWGVIPPQRRRLAVFPERIPAYRDR